MLPFDELRDPDTGRTRIRRVDVQSESYHVAREYMIRLEKADMAEPERVNRLASAAQMQPDDFRQEFSPVVDLSGVVY